MHDGHAERADGPIEIELPGRRTAGAVAIGNVPELRFVRELGGDAIFAVRINIVADNLAKRLGRRGALQQGREHGQNQRGAHGIMLGHGTTLPLRPHLAGPI